jgi:hypothetical protein
MERHDEDRDRDAPPAGLQADVSYDEAAERKSVQPPADSASSFETGVTPDQSAPPSNLPEGGRAAAASTEAGDGQAGVLSRGEAREFQTRRRPGRRGDGAALPSPAGAPDGVAGCPQ